MANGNVPKQNDISKWKYLIFDFPVFEFELHTELSTKQKGGKNDREKKEKKKKKREKRRREKREDERWRRRRLESAREDWASVLV